MAHPRCGDGVGGLPARPLAPRPDPSRGLRRLTPLPEDADARGHRRRGLRRRRSCSAGRPRPGAPLLSTMAQAAVARGPWPIGQACRKARRRRGGSRLCLARRQSERLPRSCARGARPHISIEPSRRRYGPLDGVAA